MNNSGPKRYPAAIMGTCVVPWTQNYAFDETAFRAQVRHLATNLTKHLYVFGTAGEGYAVTESQFEQITRAFLDECRNCGAEPTIGIINLSLQVMLERIEKARAWGARRIQVSLPSWGALTEQELDVFFRETCGRFRDLEFMHYNLMRTKRVVTAVEYGRLAAEHPNFVATKNTKDDEVFLGELLTHAPQLQHFLSESGYTRMRDRFECGLLISIASTNHRRAQAFFVARGDELRALNGELRHVLAALKTAVGTAGHIDGVFDKLLYKLGVPEFPLRLQPPYTYADDAALVRFREEMSRLAPTWLP